MKRAHPRLHGRHLGASFRVIECEHDPDPDVLRALCLGDGDLPAVAHVVRNAISPEVSTKFAQNFWNILDSIGGSQRSNDSTVTVLQVGATQYLHTAAEYLEQCNRTRTAVEGLFEGLSSTAQARILGDHWLLPSLADVGMSVEPARFNGIEVNACTARSWCNGGAFNLEPHEDQAQLLRAEEDNFEIGATTSLVAWVCCMQNASGGDLSIWDVAPDQGTRITHDLSRTGYPYPLSTLNGIPRLDIPLGTGDVVLFRADFVHAIGQVTSPRLSVGRFLGVLGKRLIFWT